MPAHAAMNPSSIMIDASQLMTYQKCRRRWLLEREWRWMKWHPKSLASHCLREGVFQLSMGRAPDEICSAAQTRYMEAAANPGLDLDRGADPYQIAKDWCAALSTVLTALSRTVLLSLHKVPQTEIGTPDHPMAWLPLSFADDSGTLHRWLTVDAWDADAQARAVHSWHTVGDMAVCDAPMQLHVVEVGAMRNGRRQSPWCRAYRNPAYIPSGPAGQIRFQRPDGKGGWAALRGDKWEPVWLADLHGHDPAAWVDRMTQDGIKIGRAHV